jgi:8-oxo-dGTP pyrophosphatase MutT (NUDIX family)
MPEKLLKWVACLVKNKENKILLLKRSPEKSVYPNLWAIVAGGCLHDDKDVELDAQREIQEELGLNLTIIKRSKGLKLNQDGNLSIVYPFLFEYTKGNIILNYEHSEYKWINMEDLNQFQLVPGMRDIISKLV